MTLEEIFNSSNDARRTFNFSDYNELQELINSELIIVRRKVYTIPSKIKKMGQNGGGQFHQELCWIIRQILETRLKGKVSHEYTINGKRVDLYHETNNIIFEIGDNNPVAVKTHLINVDAFFSVPFQKLGKYLSVYKFMVTDKIELEKYNDWHWREMVNSVKWIAQEDK